jgi:hypothetical protein
MAIHLEAQPWDLVLGAHYEALLLRREQCNTRLAPVPEQRQGVASSRKQTL